MAKEREILGQSLSFHVSMVYPITFGIFNEVTLLNYFLLPFLEVIMINAGLTFHNQYDQEFSLTS